jgi:3-oxoacyl-[acyl-carrier-protein] synthase II
LETAKVPINITGIGMLNALGMSRSAFWRQLLQASPGIAPIKSFDTAEYATNLGAEIQNFNAKDFMAPRFYRRLGRLSRLAVAASIEAIKDSGLDISAQDRYRIGVVFGTAFGSTHQTDAFFVSLLDHGPQAAEPILFPDTVPNAPASHVAMYHRLQGPNCTLCQNHLSGECALAYGLSLLEQGQLDVVVVGGVDELSSILFHSLDSIRALKPIRQRGPLQPNQFPKGKGFIPGEGATCMVLERADSARRRPRNMYGTVLSLRLTSRAVAQGHYDVTGRAMAESIRAALEEAEIPATDIGIIGLAANGVDELEDGEGRALEEVFGANWHQIPRIPLRYYVGDFGSAGLLTAATIMLSLAEGRLPPAIQGPGLTDLARDTKKFASMKKDDLVAGMAIGSTFGGGSGCIVFGRQQGK